MKPYVFAAATALFLISQTAKAALVTKEVVYKDGATELTGYLVYDDAFQGSLPGVMVVHEWWGHNDYVRNRADQLAALGYVAFAADMYGTGKLATTPDEAKALSKPFYDDRKLMQSRAAAGLAILAAEPKVLKENIGVIGYCFGGTVALEVARSGADVDGVVSFHGGLGTTSPAQKGVVKARVLALNGKADSMVPESEKMGFVEEMTNAGVDFKSMDYPDAKHAFTNPAATETGKKFGLDVAYNEEADKNSWAEMREFFKKVFTVPFVPPSAP